MVDVLGLVGDVEQGLGAVGQVTGGRVEDDAPHLLATVVSPGSKVSRTVSPRGDQPVAEQARLGGLAGPVATLEADEESVLWEDPGVHAGTPYGRAPTPGGAGQPDDVDTRTLVVAGADGPRVGRPHGWTMSARLRAGRVRGVGAAEQDHGHEEGPPPVRRRGGPSAARAPAVPPRSRNARQPIGPPSRMSHIQAARVARHGSGPAPASRKVPNHAASPRRRPAGTAPPPPLRGAGEAGIGDVEAGGLVAHVAAGQRSRYVAGSPAIRTPVSGPSRGLSRLSTDDLGEPATHPPVPPQEDRRPAADSRSHGDSPTISTRVTEPLEIAELEVEEVGPPLAGETRPTRPSPARGRRRPARSAASGGHASRRTTPAAPQSLSPCPTPVRVDAA